MEEEMYEANEVDTEYEYRYDHLFKEEQYFDSEEEEEEREWEEEKEPRRL